MREFLFLFTIYIFFSCSTKKESENVVLGSKIALDCILTTPISDIPENIYSVGSIIPTENYPPFTK